MIKQQNVDLNQKMFIKVENQRILNVILVVIDIIVILFSLVLAYYVRFKTTLFGPLGGSLPFMHYLIFTIVCIIPTYLLLYYFFGLYKPFRNKSSIFSGAEDIIKSDTMAFIILVAILFVIDQPDFSRIMLFLLSLFGMIFAIIERAFVVLVLRFMRVNNRNLKHILIIGDNDLALNCNTFRLLEVFLIYQYPVNSLLGAFGNNAFNRTSHSNQNCREMKFNSFKKGVFIYPFYLKTL